MVKWILRGGGGAEKTTKIVHFSCFTSRDKHRCQCGKHDSKLDWLIDWLIDCYIFVLDSFYTICTYGI